MKTIRNLLLLLVTVSFLSSCYVQEEGRGYHHHRHYDNGWHRGW